MDCWARELGNCDGPMTGEHFVSKCLRYGKMMAIKGLPFCKDDYVKISWATAKSNVLCARHNSVLSPVDAEALRFKTTIEKIENQEHPTKGKDQLKRPVTIRICGTRFSQWLVKSCCNQLAVRKLSSPKSFVRFAFGQAIKDQIHIYFTPELDKPLKLQLGYFDFLELTGQAGCTMLVDFNGLTWIISTLDLSKLQKPLKIGEERIVTQNQLLERPNSVECQVNLPDGTRATTIVIVFDWPQLQQLT